MQRLHALCLHKNSNNELNISSVCLLYLRQSSWVVVVVLQLPWIAAHWCMLLLESLRSACSCGEGTLSSCQEINNSFLWGLSMPQLHVSSPPPGQTRYLARGQHYVSTQASMLWWEVGYNVFQSVPKDWKHEKKLAVFWGWQFLY